MKGSDIVYHFAATAHEGLSGFSPYEIGKNNYLASVSVFSAAMSNKIKRIIFVHLWQDTVARVISL